MSSTIIRFSFVFFCFLLFQKEGFWKANQNSQLLKNYVVQSGVQVRRKILAVVMIRELKIWTYQNVYILSLCCRSRIKMRDELTKQKVCIDLLSIIVSCGTGIWFKCTELMHVWLIEVGALSLHLNVTYFVCVLCSSHCQLLHRTSYDKLLKTSTKVRSL